MVDTRRACQAKLAHVTLWRNRTAAYGPDMPPPLKASREVFTSSEQILRRLRAARRPAVLIPLQVSAYELEPDPFPLETPPVRTESADLPTPPIAVIEAVKLRADEIIPDDDY